MGLVCVRREGILTTVLIPPNVSKGPGRRMHNVVYAVARDLFAGPGTQTVPIQSTAPLTDLTFFFRSVSNGAELSRRQPVGVGVGVGGWGLGQTEGLQPMFR